MSPFPKQAGPFPGGPIDVPAYSAPTAAGVGGHNPLLSNMGPASYAERKDEPDLTVHGTPRIVPMRADSTFFLDPRDPDFRGVPVVGLDKAVAGHVREIWVDRGEPQVRYLEVEVASNGRTVLLPVTNVRQSRTQGHLYVKSITAAQFADVPGTKRPDQVTLREEDQIQAYYAGGYLFAHPSRTEPLV